MAKKARTHKMKNKGKLLSIPQLRKSFDHIDSWVEHHVRKGHVKELVPAFQAEWKKTFHREVDASAAEAYLSLKQHTAPRATRKHKQMGGGSLQGAPLDYTTRQGVYGVYGNFPEYVSSGLRFYNDINQDGLTAQCGKENITPNIPASMVSNAVTQKGGRSRSRKYKTRKQRGGAQSNLLSTAAAVTDVMANRPFAASSPPTPAYVASMATKGVDVSVPSPSETKYTPQPYDPAIIKSVPAVLEVNIPATTRTSLVA